MDELALPHINKLQPYVAGKPIETLAREKKLSKIIKLASNENPFGPCPEVFDALLSNLTALNQYPDPAQYNLKSKLSDFYDITPDMLAIGNGSDELLQIIMRAFVSPENNVIFPKYSFISYKVCADSIGSTCITPDVNNQWQTNIENIIKAINQQTKLICIANPNNPTGTYIDISCIDTLLNSIPNNILVILDEAYIEFIKYFNPSEKNYSDTSIELTKKHPNLIITRTFSKAYGLAGIRAGYCIGHPDIIATINKLKQPFNVNRLVEFAAIAALNNQKYIKKLIAINNAEKQKLYSEFNNLGIEYIPSYTNFITIKTKSAEESQKINNFLLDQGIIIRPVNNYGLHEFLRISIGTPEENNMLIETLKTYRR